MSQRLKQIEKELDKRISELSIWKLPFQSILSSLLFGAENIDFNGKVDTAADYLGRLSLIYPLVKKHAKNKESNNTTQSLLATGQKEFIEDINFLNAYAHFSMLMPQVHRETLVVKGDNGNLISLDFKNSEVQYSELIDKLYSFISLHLVFSFKDQEALENFTNDKARKREYSLQAQDFIWIERIYEHYKKYYFHVHVLPSQTVIDTLGFTFDDYYSFVAAFRAYSDYFIKLGRSYKSQVDELNGNEEDNEKLMSEYMEWTVCCLKYQSLGWAMHTSKLDKSTFDKILSYYIEIVSNGTKENFIANSFCGDGYFPPLILLNESIIYSPLSLRYFLNFNNILYSINKKNRPLFDQNISPHLEPTLINQIAYLFSFYQNVETKKNVNYSESEIDLVVLSKSEETCLFFQAKTTIAPDSARTVARVQDRIIEAKTQIEKFEALGLSDKLSVINNEFGTDFKNLKFINLIVVRSSAGSEKGWSINKQFKISNYSLLSKVLCEKINKSNFHIGKLDHEIEATQNQLITDSDWSVDYETLIIGDYHIRFPDISYNDNNLMTFNLKTIKCFNQFESSDH